MPSTPEPPAPPNSPDKLRGWWSDVLGAAPDPEGAWRLGGRRRVDRAQVRGEIRRLTITSFGTELVCELLRPSSAPASGVVVVTPFYDTAPLLGEHSARTAHAGRDPLSTAYALQLAEAGHSVLTVPWWFEHVAAADPALSTAHGLGNRYGPPAERHRRERPSTGLGRSIADVVLALIALQDSGLAEGARVAAFGHSLGGKLAMHAAALDERVELAAAHEPGLGFAHSNWSAPWYLDGDIPADRDQDQLLGLVAPRPFLLAGGGDGDGTHNLDLFRSAARCWPEGRGPEVLLHDGGHALPRHVMTAIREWIRDRAA